MARCRFGHFRISMEMRSGARAAPVLDWRCSLRGYVVFYACAQATAAGIQEENQIAIYAHGRSALGCPWMGMLLRT